MWGILGGNELRKLERQVSLIVPTIDELVALGHPYRPLRELDDHVGTE